MCQLLYPSPKEGDISSDFDVSSCSDFGHESGIHPLSVFPSTDNSLENIKEEDDGEEKVVDCNLNTSSPKQTLSNTTDLTCMHQPDSFLQNDNQMVMSELSHRKEREKRKDPGVDPSADTFESIPSLKDDSCISSFNDDVFIDEVDSASSLGPSDSQEFIASNATSKSSNENDLNKVHPRLHALTQLTDHFSPVGTLVNTQSAKSKPAFSVADITTSSPISQSFGKWNENSKFATSSSQTSIQLTASDSQEPVQNTKDSPNKEIISTTLRPNAYDDKQESDHSFSSKDNTTIEHSVHQTQNNSGQHYRGNFKVPTNARGVKRSLGSVSLTSPTSSGPHSTGLTKTFGTIHFAENTPKKQDAKRCRVSKHGRTSFRAMNGEQETSNHQIKRYV